jgi:hypothetical protein
VSTGGVTGLGVLVRVEVRLITGASHDDYRYLARFDMVAVPAAGELFNIDGEPYIVRERGWAASTDGDMLCCYLDVCPAQAARRRAP